MFNFTKELSQNTTVAQSEHTEQYPKVPIAASYRGSLWYPQWIIISSGMQFFQTKYLETRNKVACWGLPWAFQALFGPFLYSNMCSVSTSYSSSFLLAPKELYTWYCPMTIRPLFENTPVLDNNLNINALMTLTMMNKITRNVKWHKISNGTKCQMTQNVKWHKVSNDTKCQMTQNIKWHKMSNDTKFQMTRNDTWHMTYDTWQMTNKTWQMTHETKFQIAHYTHDTWHMTHEVWCMMHDTWRMMINDSRQKHPASHTSERTFVPRTAIY